MINKISITTKSNKKYVMSPESYTRWLCLVEAMEFINQKAKNSKIDLDKSDKWIKPLSLQKYIKDRYHSMYHDFRIEENLNIDPMVFSELNYENKASKYVGTATF